MFKSVAVGLLVLPLSITAGEVFMPHCAGGCPEGTPETNDLIVRDIYTLSSNDETKFADWVAYVVSDETIATGCKRKWKPDPFSMTMKRWSQVTTKVLMQHCK
jgi:endonuclease G